MAFRRAQKSQKISVGNVVNNAFRVNPEIRNCPAPVNVETPRIDSASLPVVGVAKTSNPAFWSVLRSAATLPESALTGVVLLVLILVVVDTVLLPTLEMILLPTVYAIDAEGQTASGFISSCSEAGKYNTGTCPPV